MFNKSLSSLTVATVLASGFAQNLWAQSFACEAAFVEGASRSGDFLPYVQLGDDGSIIFLDAENEVSDETTKDTTTESEQPVTIAETQKPSVHIVTTPFDGKIYEVTYFPGGGTEIKFIGQGETRKRRLHRLRD